MLDKAVGGRIRIHRSASGSTNLVCLGKITARKKQNKTPAPPFPHTGPGCAPALRGAVFLVRLCFAPRRPVLSGSSRCCPLLRRVRMRRECRLSPYIECVFENDLVELDAAQTLAAAEANEHALITAETRRLHIAAHWADLHPGDALCESRLPGTEHPVQLGGDGTPTVGDFAPAELGCVLRISDGSACRLIGDALDLRHRLR